MKRFALVLFAASLTVPVAVEAKAAKPVTLTEAVGHKLAMMPYYTVFDNIAYEVDGSTVTLTGQVTRPIVKGDAGDVAQHVEGVTAVVNNIEVLPLSLSDDQLRTAIYRAIYSAPTLSTRYGFTSQPAIHIIVKNGNVSLEGVVANASDRIVAGMRAQGVFGAFKVENDLTIGS